MLEVEPIGHFVSGQRNRKWPKLQRSRHRYRFKHSLGGYTNEMPRRTAVSGGRAYRFVARYLVNSAVLATALRS